MKPTSQTKPTPWSLLHEVSLDCVAQIACQSNSEVISSLDFSVVELNELTLLIGALEGSSQHAQTTRNNSTSWIIRAEKDVREISCVWLGSAVEGGGAVKINSLYGGDCPKQIQKKSTFCYLFQLSVGFSSWDKYHILFPLFLQLLSNLPLTSPLCVFTVFQILKLPVKL